MAAASSCRACSVQRTDPRSGRSRPRETTSGTSNRDQGAAMRKFIIMGAQGCGKGTQAKLLSQELDLAHISVGDIFRWNLGARTKLAARIKRLMNDGQLVPDEIVEEVVKNRLDLHDWNF